MPASRSGSGGASSLREMIAAGPRAVSRYTGTLFAVFIAQTVVALAAMLAFALVLAQAFAHLPAFDDAVDGDLVAMIGCLRFARASMLAVVGIAFGALVMWQLAAWFLAGGVYGVLAQRPEGRQATARCFGASGASTYLAYARLALCAIPGWLIVAFVWLACWNLVEPRLQFALTTWDLVSSLLVAVVPAALLWHVAATVIDYARVELALRDDSHAPGAALAYARALGFVLRRPVTLVHGLLGHVAWLVLTFGSVWLAQGHPMYGAEGAITLFVLRQGVALARMALRFGVLAGQVELGRTRPPPPRRVEVKLEVTA
jgi:hypothetical protein